MYRYSNDQYPCVVELEIVKMNTKAEAGARFFITPCLTWMASPPLLKCIDLNQIKIIPTVLALTLLGMARYIARNMGNVYLLIN